MAAASTHAIVRPPTRSLVDCLLLHLPRQPLDFDCARRQHAGYVLALEQAGASVTRLPVAPDFPDAVFVEDTAIILDEVALLCRPGAASRRGETALIREAVARLRPVVEIQSPGTLEGGDVLRVGRTLFVGHSTRTDEEGIRQLRAIVTPLGYDVIEIAVTGCLHLKTALTSPGGRVLLANPAWLGLPRLPAFEVLVVPAAEPWGANILPLNGRVLVAASAPQTAGRLASKGLDVHRVDISELQKAEAGLTCLSLPYESGIRA